MTIAGIITCVLSVVALEVPGIFVKVSLSDAHSVCSSSIGALGQAFSSQIAGDCSDVGLG